MSFYGKAVRFTENGKEVDAFIVHEHQLIPEAQGAGGQPLVHLVLADPAKESLNLADMHAKLLLRLDVAHASQQFSEDWKRLHKDQQVWPGGRWSEYGTSPLGILDGIQEAQSKAEAAASETVKREESVDEQLASVNAQIDALSKQQQLEDAKKKLASLQGGSEAVN